MITKVNLTLKCFKRRIALRTILCKDHSFRHIFYTIEYQTYLKKISFHSIDTKVIELATQIETGNLYSTFEYRRVFKNTWNHAAMQKYSFRYQSFLMFNYDHLSLRIFDRHGVRHRTNRWSHLASYIQFQKLFWESIFPVSIIQIQHSGKLWRVFHTNLLSSLPKKTCKCATKRSTLKWFPFFNTAIHLSVTSKIFPSPKIVSTKHKLMWYQVHIHENHSLATAMMKLTFQTSTALMWLYFRHWFFYFLENF